MSTQATLEWLSDAVGHATRSANFCTSGCLPVVDPELEVQGLGPIKLPLIDKIDRRQCDVKHALERKGSPYSLVLTKATGSFQRAVKEFATNRRLLSDLPAVE